MKGVELRRGDATRLCRVHFQVTWDSWGILGSGDDRYVDAVHRPGRWSRELRCRFVRCGQRRSEGASAPGETPVDNGGVPRRWVDDYWASRYKRPELSLWAARGNRAREARITRTRTDALLGESQSAARSETPKTGASTCSATRPGSIVHGEGRAVVAAEACSTRSPRPRSASYSRDPRDPILAPPGIRYGGEPCWTTSPWPLTQKLVSR